MKLPLQDVLKRGLEPGEECYVMHVISRIIMDLSTLQNNVKIKFLMSSHYSKYFHNIEKRVMTIL